MISDRSLQSVFLYNNEKREYYIYVREKEERNPRELKLSRQFPKKPLDKNPYEEYN